MPDHLVGTGLTQLENHCFSVYPPQTQSPFLMRTTKSFIKDGGSDPLDLIHIYKNEGDPSRGIPQHWHYISFGLSDIYGYSILFHLHELMIQDPMYSASTQPLPQIYPKQGSSPERLSGFGFELTFRVKCNSADAWNQEPPKWPGLVMQALAKYVFQSKNVFSAGDHVAWHCSLDGEEDSRIEHMLMTIDPQLEIKETNLGKVRFIQLVGVCQEELQASREWNVKGILEMMKERDETGGAYLVTDMRRGESIFELDPEYRERFNRGILEMGSDLALISAKHKYSSSKPKWYKDIEENYSHENDIKDDMEVQDFSSERSIINNSVLGVEKGNFFTMTRNDLQTSHDNQPTRCGSRMSYESETNLLVENAELADTRYYDNVYILLSYESAKVLPVVLSGRLAHGRHFTYQSLKGDLCTTFVPERALREGIESLVSKEQPLVKKGIWLQIYVSDDLREQMLESLKADFDHGNVNENETISLPRNYSWPDHKLHITVVEEID